MSTNFREKIINQLYDLLGKENVLTEIYDLVCYSRDRYPPAVYTKELKLPLAVVRPASTEQVQEIVLLANKHLVPLVPRGGGTNFAGSAMPIKNCIILDLTRMNKVIEIDTDARSVRVQTGVTLQALEEKLNNIGFTFGHDPGSFPSATVGGSIATEALGWRAGKYGDMGQLVLGLQVVLPTGSILETRSIPKSSTGFDINKLFIGSEGTLGIITEATLRIHPLPEKRVILFYAFRCFESAQESLIKILKKGLSPATMLVIDEKGVQEFLEEVNGETLKAGLIITYEGLKEEVEAQKMRTIEILEKNGAIDLGDDAAQRFWNSRHDMYSIMNMEGTYDNVDTAVPVSKSKEFYKYLKFWAEKHNIKSLGISSWMLPENVSIDFVFDESSPDNIQKYLKARDEAAEKALELGGTLSYCIGVGIRYPHLMKKEHGIALEIMRAIKKVLDPNNIMNPGKMGL